MILAKDIRRWLQFLLLFLIGCFLVYLSFRKLDLSDLLHLIGEGDYRVCIPVFTISLIGYITRSARWQLLLNAVHQPARIQSLLAALCIGYTVNFATPRLGEISRCLVVKKTDNVRLELSLLTIVVERVLDTLCLLVLLVAAFVLNMQKTYQFFTEYVFQPMYESFAKHQWLILALISVGIGALILLVKFSGPRVGEFVRTMKDSLKQIVQLKEQTRFWFYTVIIWSCYFLMTYLWLFVFEESSSLGVREAFVVMVVGSIGRSVPIQGGGMGAYHYLVGNAFALFGISLLTGNALAVIIHGAQAVFTFCMGTISYVWMLLDNKQRTA